MKKILLALVLIICIFMFAGCSHMATEDSHDYGYFIEITQYNVPGGWTTFMYDPVTKIIYVKISGGYHAGISVYYTIVDGQPEVAVYGVNWTEADLMGDVK